ncbi:MAG: tetratricopeptide repeat protein [Candidatus Amulumruptor caecigallinarius]|nr:tetratricopeptide repeat protein [Candidatus Amulumruptor caecigallinarius]MCM1396589.1 tetratricopeptide repeat protein [Candidatus Amulumruptor caecigallinarius]MCM1453353.1 tetratricopeptide repeat protein [bacterium]
MNKHIRKEAAACSSPARRRHLWLRALLTPIAALMLLPVLAGSKASRWDREAAIHKADYLFMESERRKALAQNDAYFETLGEALRLNPSDKAMGFDYGFYEVMMDGRDSAAISRGYGRMADYFRSTPTDIYNGLTFARLSEVLGLNDRARDAWRQLHTVFPDRGEVALRYAQAMLTSPDSADHRLALAAYDSIESADGKDLQVTNLKVNYYLQQRDTANVRAELAALLEAFPRSANVASYAGDVNAALGNKDAALNYYRIACATDSTNGYAYYSLANFYRSIGDEQAYNREILNALTKQSLDVETKLRILGSYIESEGVTAAAQAAVAAPADTANMAEVVDIAEADTVVPVSPDSLMAEESRIDDLFRVLLEQHPHEPEIYGFYASYLVSIPDFVGAAQAMSSKLDIEPNDLPGWQGLLSLDLQNNDMQGAESDAMRALRYFPDDARLLLMLGGVLQQQERYPEAMKALTHAMESTDSADLKTLSMIKTSIGDVNYASGDKAKAFTDYRAALELDPDNNTALNNCAYYLACEGKDLDQALEMARKALAENPDSPTTLDTYAWVLFKLKKYDEALTAISRVLDLLPDEERHGEELDHAGDINFMNGNRAEALKYWKEALKLDKDNELLRRKVKERTIFFE